MSGLADAVWLISGCAASGSSHALQFESLGLDAEGLLCGGMF